MAEPLPAAPNRRSWLLPLGYGALLFLPMLRNQFWLDDYGWVSSAMDGVRNPAHLIGLAKTDLRPLVNLTFAVNFLVSDLNPVGYYLFNLALHLANTWLVMRLAARVSRDSTVALVTGFLFAGAFANYGQAVVWISGRTGLLADLLMLACLLAHLSWLEGGRPRDRTWTAVWFGLAFLAKESAVVLLPLMLLVEWVHGRRLRELLSLATARAYAPYAVVLIGYLSLQFGFLRKNSPILDLEYRLGWHVVTNFAEYLARMVIPVNATTMMVAVPAGLHAALAVAQTVLMIALPVLGIVLLVRPVPRWVKFGVAWTVISLLPYLAFTFRTSTRYLYGPSVGFALVVAWLLSPAWAGMPAAARGRIARAAVVALLLVQAVVINVVIHEHYRVQQSQDPKYHRELLEQRRTGAVGGTTMKTIGVIGGIGPQATMDFEARVHRVAQRRIPPHFNRRIHETLDHRRRVRGRRARRLHGGRPADLGAVARLRASLAGRQPVLGSTDGCQRTRHPADPGPHRSKDRHHGPVQPHSHRG